MAAEAAAAAIPLNSVLLLPGKPLRPISFLQPLCSKRPIFAPSGFTSRRSTGPWMLRVSGSRGMAELTTISTADSIGSEDGDGGGELGEAEAILGNGSAAVLRSSSAASPGVESTLNRMSKWIVSALFGIVLVWKHDAEAMWAAMGSVINVWLSITLKQMLNHQRPVPQLKSDPGMPSSHAQSIFYGASFLILALVQWLGINLLTVTIGTATVAGSSYFAWLRVSQQFHTTSQVVVGAVLGTACATIWFWLWHAFVLKAFIASIWVRIPVILGSFVFCVLFVLHVIKHWLKEED